MSTLVDSNVLLDVLTRDSQWFQWSSIHLHDAVLDGAAINQLIYAEISTDFNSADEVDAMLSPRAIRRLSIPWKAAFPAAQAFAKYRRLGGIRTSPLPDFYIGAHAAISGLKILTRDANRYRTYFPDVELICPD